jgi:hypothetical protein
LCLLLAVVLLLTILYVFQLVSSPSFLKSQVNSVTGLVVSDSPQQTTATSPSATPTSSGSSGTTKEEQKKPASQQTATVSAPSTITTTTPQNPLIKIIEPAKGSTVSPGFIVKVEFNQDAFVCYYQVRDNGAVTWDRRMRPCKTEFTVEPGYCKTAGKNTCFVHVDASNQDSSVVSNDETYYSIQ